MRDGCLHPPCSPYLVDVTRQRLTFSALITSTIIIIAIPLLIEWNIETGAIKMGGMDGTFKEGGSPNDRHAAL